MSMKKICIIGGCGHVGFPLGLVLAECGYETTLIDKNLEAVELINSGAPPF